MSRSFGASRRDLYVKIVLMAALPEILAGVRLGLIRGLSRDQQQVLTLRYVFDFTNGEAAAILGKTENAVKQLQHRAIGSLQQRLVHA